MTAPTKRRSSKPRKRVASKAKTVHLALEDQVSLVDVAGKRMTPWANMLLRFAAIVTATTVVVGGCVAFWTYFGLPWWVSNHELAATVNIVKAGIESKIQAAKVEVTDLSNKNTREVKVDVSKLGETVDKLAKKNEQNTITSLEGQGRFLFAQKNNYVATLGSIDAQLRDKPGDTFLLQRRAEVQNALDYITREQEAIQRQLRRLRGQED